MLHALMHLAAQVAAAAPAQPVSPVTTSASPSFGATVAASLAGAFAVLFTIIPRLLGALVIVAVGWLLANVLARGTRTLLHALRVDEIARRTGVADVIEQMNSDAEASGMVATGVKWLVRFATLLVAFDALGLAAASDILRQFLLWLPNLVVAVVVLALGGLAARALGNVVRGATANAGFSNPDTLATVTRGIVWAFAFVVAVNQVGIASTLVNTLFMGVVGALALATGLAFGLGGRDLAQRTLEGWNGQLQRARPKLERASSLADRQVDPSRRVASPSRDDRPRAD